MMEQIKQNFQTIFQGTPKALYFAPGRVNLIGEHTDYNGGHVFPSAIHLGTYLAIRPRSDRKLRFYSENFSGLGIIESSLDQLVYLTEDDWSNYPKGVLKVFIDHGHSIPHGFDFYFVGNIPNGAGLSSSASIELVTAVMLNDVFKFNIDQIKLCLFGQQVENEFIGVNSGIMDQFAIGMGKKDHAIFLNTNTLHYEYAPLDLTGYTIIVANTNKRRGLADSKYNERRAQCEEALKLLQSACDITSLGDLSIERFENHKHLIEDDVVRRRAKHAVYENVRTLEAKHALDQGDLKRFGELMNVSHRSLRDDYEVTGLELDTLVGLAWEQAGVIGSRMTGAGFGGCTVSIVKDEHIETFERNVGSQYQERVGLEASFYHVKPGDGARKLLDWSE